MSFPLSKILKKLTRKGIFVCECEFHDDYPEGFALFWHEYFHEIFLDRVYWPAISWIRRNVEYTGRSLAWFRFMYHNHDFDSVFLYSVLGFKARRLLWCMDNGHCVHECDNTAALKEFITICDRLYVQRYDDKYHEEHDQKWGKTTATWDSTPHSFYSNGKPKTFELNFPKKPNVKTPEDEIQERKDFLDIGRKEEIDRVADIDQMAEILKKHARSWWD